MRSRGLGRLRSRAPRGTRDARRRAMGEAMAAARARPTRALRATANPRRATSRRAARIPEFQFSSSSGFRPAGRRPRRGTRATGPISGSPMVGRFWAPPRTDSPRVMPETRCVSKNWGWWPGAESNHRHADFQSAGERGSAQQVEDRERVFSGGRPNRPARPNLSRTGRLKTCRTCPGADPGQRLTHDSTERFPSSAAAEGCVSSYQ